MRLLLIALTLMAGPVLAKTFSIGRPIDPDLLKSEARAAGFTDAELSRRGIQWTLHYADSVLLDPAPLVAAHDHEVKVREKDELMTIVIRLKLGTSTREDERKILLYLLEGRGLD